jgi:iron complex transport system ATP-binding protein
MLTIEDVCASYGGAPVVRNVTLAALQPGSVTALIGPNAAGKSTLLKAVAGLMKQATGAIRLGDCALDALPLGPRARHVRFVPQVYATQARLTVFELLLVARMCGGRGRPDRTDIAAVETALERVAIAHLADRYAGALSGGQQQLVSLAQALTRPAPVLLLDEPTSALDLRHQLEAFAVMRRVAQEENAIVVAALHDLNMAARHADRVILMGQGTVLADGLPPEVLTSERCGPAYGVALASGRTTRGSMVIEAYLPTT